MSAFSNKQSEIKPEDPDIQHTKSGLSTKHNFETDSKLADNLQIGKWLLSRILIISYKLYQYLSNNHQ